MDWYYSDNGQQVGPVAEEEFAALAQAGTITGQTLVWHGGLSDWQALSAVRPDLVGGAAAVVPAAAAIPDDLTIQSMREGGDVTAGVAMNYAGFWIRLGAKIIDGILLQIVLFPVNLVIGFAAGAAEGNPDAAGGALIASTLLTLAIGIAVPLLYNGLMIGKYGATLGKMACGLRVVMPDGSKVSTARGFGRYLGEIVSSIILSIGYIIAAFDSEKRALHDHIASTRVIRIR